MRFSVAAAVFSAFAFASASKPFDGFPLENGFPTPSTAAVAKIEEHAGGSVPNGALPTKLSAAAVPALQLVALNEIFEVAYFTDLLKNITNGTPGFKSQNKKYLMRTFRRIRAAKELHAYGANAILESAGQKTVGGCKYVFPVTNLATAISTANLFTDVVLGVIPQVQALFASDGGDEAALIPLLGSILAQEGEQVGYFRSYQGKPPSAAPFLTGTAAQFAYSALKMFIVPGSCSVLPDIPSFSPITIVNTPAAMNMVLTMAVEGDVDASKMSVVYMSGQTLPVTVPISDVSKKAGTTMFKAKFPYSQGFAKGLTLAAVTNGTGKKFASVNDVAAAAVYGPGLIEIG